MSYCYFFSGPDNSSKGTQIFNFKKYLEEKGKTAHVIHYSAIKGNDIENRSKQHYKEMFNLIKFSTQNEITTILDRGHEGETIYGPMYRGYDGNYVYDLEKNFGPRVLNQIKLIMFTASPETLIMRDDGLSFSTDLDKKMQEIDLFKQFFNKTSIKDKILIDITGKTIEQVWSEVKNFIGEV